MLSTEKNINKEKVIVGQSTGRLKCSRAGGCEHASIFFFFFYLVQRVPRSRRSAVDYELAEKMSCACVFLFLSLYIFGELSVPRCTPASFVDGVDDRNRGSPRLGTKSFGCRDKNNERIRQIMMKKNNNRPTLSRLTRLIPTMVNVTQGLRRYRHQPETPIRITHDDRSLHMTQRI